MTDGHAFTGVSEGDILAGKYRIDKILGAGGMGVVVAAHHIALDDKVAIKFLLPEMLSNGEAVARFEREARAAVKIKSDHVARVSDVGTLEDGAPYMVMEYLEGGDLSAWLKQRGPLEVEQAAEFVLQACEAIAEAHTLGIVHRDLKPANLFVIQRPDTTLSVKVLDFGISKMRGAGTSVPDISITKTSATMGSPLYMSPEQMQSAKDVDSRTDIWALGIILYELVAGETPFPAETMQGVVAKILSMPPPPIRNKRPDVPDGFEAVILRCVEKDRNRRYESVGQLAADLLPFAPRRSRLSLERISGIMRSAGLSATALALPPSSDPTEEGTGGTQGAWGRTSVSGGRTTLTLIVGGLLLAAGASAFFLLRQPLAAPPTEPTPSVATQPSMPSAPVREVPLPVLRPGAPAASTTSAAPLAEVAPVARAAPPPPPRIARSQSAPPKTLVPTATQAPEAPRPSPPAATVAPKPSSPTTRKSSGAFDDRK